jgi:hypothetical protein
MAKQNNMNKTRNGEGKESGNATDKGHLRIDGKKETQMSGREGEGERDER